MGEGNEESHSGEERPQVGSCFGSFEESILADFSLVDERLRSFILKEGSIAGVQTLPLWAGWFIEDDST